MKEIKLCTKLIDIKKLRENGNNFNFLELSIKIFLLFFIVLFVGTISTFIGLNFEFDIQRIFSIAVVVSCIISFLLIIDFIYTEHKNKIMKRRTLYYILLMIFFILEISFMIISIWTTKIVIFDDGKYIVQINPIFYFCIFLPLYFILFTILYYEIFRPIAFFIPESKNNKNQKAYYIDDDTKEKIYIEKL